MAIEEIIGNIDEIFTDDEDIVNGLTETNVIEEPEDSGSIPDADTDSGQGGSSGAEEIVINADEVLPDEEDDINELSGNDLTEPEIAVDEEEVTPLISNTELLPTIGNVNEGDRVMIALVNGEATVIGVVGKGDETQAEVDEAVGAARRATISADDLDRQINGIGLYWSAYPYTVTTPNNYPVIINGKQLADENGEPIYWDTTHYSEFEEGFPTSISYDIDVTDYPIYSGEENESGTIDYAPVLSSNIVDLLETKVDSERADELADLIDGATSQIATVEDSVEEVAGNIEAVNVDLEQMKRDIQDNTEAIINITGKVTVSDNVMIGDSDKYNMLLDSETEPSIKLRYGTTSYATMTKEELNIPTANIKYLRLGHFLLEIMDNGQLVLKER